LFSSDDYLLMRALRQVGRAAGGDGESGEGGLADGIAGDAAVPHYARLSHVPWHAAMEEASIVPDHGIAGRPVVMIDARRLACEVHQLLQEPLGLRSVHTRNIVRVATDYQRLPAGLGMD